jgi:DnaK suppressor protein
MGGAEPGLAEARAGKVVGMDEAKARALLAAARERIEKALSEKGGRVDDGELTGIDQHLGDQATELYTEEFEAGQRERLQDELAAIARAEERLEAGKYGLSVESGEPIPDERLEAVPWAERTAEEQSRFDGRRG